MKPLEEDYIKQFQKCNYLLVLYKNKVIVKVKQTAFLTEQEEVIIGYQTITNRIKKYIPDLMQANLVEKVSN